MLREITSPQRKMRLLAIRFDATSGAIVEQEGKNDAAIVYNDVGDYTLTFSQAFARKPVCVATCATADCYAESVDADNTNTVLHLLVKNNADAATDAVVHLFIMGPDVADQI